MPIHDWRRVEAGIFHHFHHSWIEEIQRVLNRTVLPETYYAMAEQYAAGLGPDVLTLQNASPDVRNDGDADEGRGALLTASPKVQIISETELDQFRRKQKRVAIRHVSDDHVVAVVEVVSPGNKASRHAMRSFVHKAADLLEHGVHLLVLDLHAPTARDPQGIHGVIWEEISGEEYAAPAEQRLTLAAYESSVSIKAYVQPLSVGDNLVDMPLFLEPGAYVDVPLESSYGRAFEALPRRWRRVLDSDA